MYSCVFWCEFIDLVDFLGCYCLNPVTLYIIRKATQKNSRGSGRRFFRPEANFYHRCTAVNVSKRNISRHVAGNEHFLEPLGPKYLLSSDAVKNGTWTRGVGSEVKVHSTEGGSVNKENHATNVSCCYSNFIDLKYFAYCCHSDIDFT